jgi:hypothetical protein
MVNRTYADLARHYGTAISPARPHHPKDKAIASYCTSSWRLRGDRCCPRWAGAAAATALEDSRVGCDLPEATVQAVCVTFFDEPLAAPFVHGRPRDTELGGDLPRREHAAAAQPVVSARQFVGTANEGNLL